MAEGQDQINLSWTAPGDDGGSPITGYRIQWRADTSGTWADLTTTGVTLTYSDKGLDPATTRHYRVYAINAVGQSANPSNDDSARTGGEPCPGDRPDSPPPRREQARSTCPGRCRPTTAARRSPAT